MESVEKMAKSHMKNVVQFDMYGNFISVFNSIKEASLITKTNYTSISNVCRGKIKVRMDINGGFLLYLFNEEISYSQSILSTSPQHFANVI